MPQIQVLYVKFTRPLEEAVWNRYLTLLPVALQSDVLRFKKWRDRHARLFGRLLLVVGMRRYGLGVNLLEALRTDAHGRPYVDGQMDFNISHSGEFAACCVSEAGRVGVDIEQLRDCDLAPFEGNFDQDVWESIIDNANPLEALFRHWTRVECALKADGRGLALDSKQVRMCGQAADLDGSTWYVHEPDLDAGYCCSIATDVDCAEIEVVEVDFSDPETAGLLLPGSM